MIQIILVVIEFIVVFKLALLVLGKIKPSKPNLTFSLALTGVFGLYVALVFLINSTVINIFLMAISMAVATKLRKQRKMKD